MTKKPTTRGHDQKPIIMVSSAVYGIESLLEGISAALSGFGYKVWMSHKGSIPVHPKKSNFANCLEAVKRCDLFLGIIAGRYGSGKKGGELSITHREMLAAIQEDKLRWFLAHRDVITARQLFRQFRTKEGSWCKGFRLADSAVIDDLRIIDMYEAAIRQDLPLGHRTGNWVQSFVHSNDALNFIQEQFGEIERIKKILQEDGR